MSAALKVAEVAVEIAIAEREAAMCFALELEALAGRIGLSRDATMLVLDQYETRAKLLHDAHLFFRDMIALAEDQKT
jgi:hypothetical protein